jgi:hypothetical protein
MYEDDFDRRHPVVSAIIGFFSCLGVLIIIIAIIVFLLK